MASAAPRAAAAPGPGAGSGDVESLSEEFDILAVAAPSPFTGVFTDPGGGAIIDVHFSHLRHVAHEADDAIAILESGGFRAPAVHRDARARVSWWGVVPHGSPLPGENEATRKLYGESSPYGWFKWEVLVDRALEAYSVNALQHPV